MKQLGIGYAAADKDAVSIVPCSDIESLERDQTLDPAKCYKYTGISHGRWVKGALYNALQWHVERDFCDVCGKTYPAYHASSCTAAGDTWVCPECKYGESADNIDTAPKHARRCSMSGLHSVHITYTTADPRNLSGWYALVSGPAYGEGATYKKLQQEGSDDRSWQPYTDSNARTIVGTASGYEVQNQSGQSIASWSTLHGTSTVSSVDGTVTGTIVREHVGGCSFGDDYPARIVVATPDTYMLITDSAAYAGTYTRTHATRPTSTDGEYAPVYTNGSKYIYFALNRAMTDSGAYESLDALTLASDQFSAAFTRAEWGIFRTTTPQPESDREAANEHSGSNLVVDARSKVWGSSNIPPTSGWFAASKYQEYFWASAYKVRIEKADPICAALTQTQYSQIETLESGSVSIYPGITYEASISSASTLSPAVLALTTSAWWTGPTTVAVSGYDTSPITATCRLSITVGDNASVTLNDTDLTELVSGYRYECEVSWDGSTMNTTLKVLSKTSTDTTT